VYSRVRILPSSSASTRLRSSAGFPVTCFLAFRPGGSDVLNIRMKCTGLTYTVVVRDGFGRTQQFTWSSDN
jgi:hypothetical protein